MAISMKGNTLTSLRNSFLGKTYVTNAGTVTVTNDFIYSPDGRTYSVMEDMLFGPDTVTIIDDMLMKNGSTYILDGTTLLGPETWTDVDGMDEAKVIVAVFG